MKYINLRELYPDVYKTDTLVEVTEEVFAVIQASDRAEDAYKRRMYRYKAQYSLDCNNGIEKCDGQPPTPEEILEDKQLREQLYAAVMLCQISKPSGFMPTSIWHDSKGDCPGGRRGPCRVAGQHPQRAEEVG